MERTLSQLLPGANKVVNALRLRTKAFIAGLIQSRWTPWSKPKHGFDNYHNKDIHNINTKRIVSKSLGSNLWITQCLQTYLKTMLPLNLNPQLIATSALRANDSKLENITDTYS